VIPISLTIELSTYRIIIIIIIIIVNDLYAEYLQLCYHTQTMFLGYVMLTGILY